MHPCVHKYYLGIFILYKDTIDSRPLVLNFYTSTRSFISTLGRFVIQWLTSVDGRKTNVFQLFHILAELFGEDH